MSQRKFLIDYSRFLTDVSRARKPSPIRVLNEIYAKNKETMISLAGGMPNGKMFPFLSAEFRLRNGELLKFDEHMTSNALQYGPTPGMPEFIKQLTDLIYDYHKPPTMNSESNDCGLKLCVTNGCTDGLAKIFDMLISSDDNILVEEPTYTGSLAAIRPYGCNIVGVAGDHDGMRIDCLKDILSRWSPQDAHDLNSKIPRIIYIIPNCSNPTGGSLSLERRYELYQVAQEYNLLIIEDDPYYFLQFQKKPLPSLLSMDVDGRVIRVDSFSKICSAGFRLGFVSGPHTLVDRIILAEMTSNLHISGISQMMMNSLFNLWGKDGFKNHIKEVVDFYKTQKDYAIKAAEKYLTGLAEWHEPTGSMFLWMKILGVSDTKAMIEERGREKKILLVPGCYFNVDENKSSNYIRAAYSIASPEEIDEAFRRLSELIIEEQKLV